MSIIESVRTFIVSYDKLAEFAPVRVDLLDKDSPSYSIDPVPSNTVISEDIVGNKIKQFIFVLQSREPWSLDTENNMDNIAWYEEFSAWLDTKTRAGELPTMASGQTPIEIRALDSGYLFAEGEGVDKAVYQIQCVLTYEQKKGA